MIRLRRARAWAVRLLGTFGRSSRDRELAREIEHHLSVHADELMRGGLAPEEARRQARLAFGPVEAIKESYRDQRGVPPVRDLLKDSGQAWRTLRRDKAFSGAVIVILGIGIGVATGAFALAYGTTMAPLGFPHADRLVWLGHTLPGMGLQKDLGIAGGVYRAYREHNKTLEALGLFQREQRTLVDEADAPVLVRTADATGSVFTTLGATARIGRTLSPQDDAAAAERAVLLSYEFWSSRYGASDEVLGSTVAVDGDPARVVGVLQHDFAVPGPQIDVWMDGSALDLDSFGSFNAGAVARHRPGKTLEDVRRDLAGIAGNLADTWPDVRAFLNAGQISPIPESLKTRVVSGWFQPVWVFFATACAMLAISTVNALGLLLARGRRRLREVTIRRALGAGRWRAGRVAVLEGALPACLAGLLGIGVAAAIIRFVAESAPVEMSLLALVGVDDAVVAGFALLLTIGVASILGIAPVYLMVGGRARVADARDRDAARALRPGRAMLVFQAAIGMVLVVGAGLATASLDRLRAVDPGFDSSNLLTFELVLPPSEYPSAGLAADFHLRLLDRLRTLPGVASAGAAKRLPLKGKSDGNPMSEEGSRLVQNPPRTVWVNRATDGYFDTMRIPLERGRDLTREDLERRSEAIVVNRALADLLWPGDNPLGKRVSNLTTGRPPVWSTVVGVVGTPKVDRLDETPQPMAWATPLGFHYDDTYRFSFALRTTVPPHTLADDVRRVLAAADPGLVLIDLATGGEVLRSARAPVLFSAGLMLVAAALGLILGAVGVYGATQHAVSERTPELGIKLALGARADAISRQFVTESAWLTLAGVCVGGVAWCLLGTTAASMLFAVNPLEPALHVGAAALLLLVAVAAAWLPSREAERIDPTTVLSRSA